MKLKRKDFFLLLFFMFLFGKIQTRFETPLFDDNYLIILYCGAIIFLCLIGKIGNKVNLSTIRWLVLLIILILYTLIFAGIFYQPSLSTYIISYTLAFSSMIIYEFATAYYIAKKGIMESFLKGCYMVIMAILFVCYLIHFDGLMVLRNLSTFLEPYRERSTFGFTHANTTAEICLAAYSISLVLRAGIKDNYIRINRCFYRIMAAFDLFMIIIIVSTTCKGAIVALLAMYAAYWYWTEYDKKRGSNRLLFGGLVILFGLIIGFNFYINFISSGKIDIKYRLMNFSINIPTLILRGKLWTGLGFVEKSVFSRGLVIPGTGYTDNYYLYILVSTGIIGCIIILTVLITIWRGINVKVKLFNNSYTSRSVQAINVMALVFALTEATYLSPVSITSLITIMIMLIYLLQGDKMFGVKNVKRIL